LSHLYLDILESILKDIRFCTVFRFLNYIFLLVVIIIFIVSYKGLVQPEIFIGEFSRISTGSGIEIEKYKKSTLTADKAEQYYQKLKKIIDEKKPYLKSDLTMPALAKTVSISVHHLSQLINEKCNLNYFDFINGYRVEEAKKMLSDPGYQNLNIAAVGFNSGFNSLSSFNSAFKKYTGMTPSQFRLIQSK